MRRQDDTLRADAVALALLAEVCAPLPHRDHRLDRVVERVQPHRPVAAVDERADVAALKPLRTISSCVTSRSCSSEYGHVHVVQLRPSARAGPGARVAEDRRAALGVVRPDALEHARAVVQGVGQYVYLRVLPGDELAVQPDEVRGVGTYCPPFRGSRGRPVWRPPWWRRRRGPESGGQPRAQCRSPILARRPRLSMSSPWRSIIATEPNMASGFALPVPAMSGAEPWTGSNRPGPPAPTRGAREHPDRAGEHRRLVAEDVAEHVLGEDHVELRRGATPAASRRCPRAGGRARCPSCSAARGSTTSRHRREVSSTLALSTLVTFRRASLNATRAIRSISSTL